MGLIHPAKKTREKARDLSYCPKRSGQMGLKLNDGGGPDIPEPAWTTRETFLMQPSIQAFGPDSPLAHLTF